VLRELKQRIEEETGQTLPTGKFDIKLQQQPPDQVDKGGVNGRFGPRACTGVVGTYCGVKLGQRQHL
jgi:hypothetical protein